MPCLGTEHTGLDVFGIGETISEEIVRKPNTEDCPSNHLAIEQPPSLQASNETASGLEHGDMMDDDETENGFPQTGNNDSCDSVDIPSMLPERNINMLT